jgi:methylmalonyl-CoA mutase N-terminal domain/subunit
MEIDQGPPKRDDTIALKTLGALTDASRGDANLIPYTLDATRAYATVGEITQAVADVFGHLRETPRF